MASVIRASIIIKSFLSNGSRTYKRTTTSILPIRSSLINTTLFHYQQQQQCIQHPFSCRSVSTVPVDIKWETVTDIVSSPEITGAIIPFAEQNFIQMIAFPYTYSVMYYMDFLINYMPWWVAIVATTATVRLVFFPLILKQNIMGIKVYNLLPETQKIQAKINEAMCSGDSYATAINRTKLKLLYEEHNLGIRRRLLPIFIQAPMFMSLFFLLRKLATHPVESLITGGAFWFTNLTIPDPFYILPVMTCTSLFLLFEYGMGVEGASGPMSTMGPAGRWVMRILPVGLFFALYNFPAAVLLFWTTNNFFTLFYALLLRQPWVMQKLNIPKRLIHDPASLPLTNQTFSSQFKTAVDQGKARRTTLDIRRLDDIAFRKAGVGPLRKTYKNPPTKEDE